MRCVPLTATDYLYLLPFKKFATHWHAEHTYSVATLPCKTVINTRKPPCIPPFAVAGPRAWNSLPQFVTDCVKRTSSSCSCDITYMYTYTNLVPSLENYRRSITIIVNDYCSVVKNRQRSCCTVKVYIKLLPVSPVVSSYLTVMSWTFGRSTESDAVIDPSDNLQYYTEVMQSYQPGRSGIWPLQVPKQFHVHAATFPAWSRLPETIRQVQTQLYFKKPLKSVLFAEFLPRDSMQRAVMLQ